MLVASLEAKLLELHPSGGQISRQLREPRSCDRRELEHLRIAPLVPRGDLRAASACFGGPTFVMQREGLLELELDGRLACDVVAAEQQEFARRPFRIAREIEQRA